MTWLSWAVIAGIKLFSGFCLCPGCNENETTDNEDGLPLNELCLLDADEDGYGDVGSYYADEDGTDCDDDDAGATVGVWPMMMLMKMVLVMMTPSTVCSLDSDGDEKNDMVEVGGDCDDTPATVDSTTEEVTDLGGTMTYPGAAEMDSETECLTDNDDDGYGADNTVAGLYEQAVTAGDTIRYRNLMTLMEMDVEDMLMSMLTMCWKFLHWTCYINCKSHAHCCINRNNAGQLDFSLFIQL